jgi:ribosomal protein S18 acetylase RimI-like enzyme
LHAGGGGGGAIGSGSFSGQPNNAAKKNRVEINLGAFIINEEYSPADRSGAPFSVAPSSRAMIRPGTIADLEILIEGNRAMARETESIELDEATVRSGVRAILEGKKPGAYRVLEENGRVVAQLMLTYEWSDWRNREVWWIQSVYVWPQARRSGYFRSLYRAVIDEAKAGGAGGVRLYVDERNQRAQETYRSLGMIGEHYRVFEDMWS